MIKRLIDRIMNRKTPRAAVRDRPKSYRGSEHGVHIEDVPDSAMRTCETLQKAGFKAYVVGGGVRDLMLGLKPKDFDVATDATPDQVRALFRRSRIIGRRFQIVHVMFGRDTIEVSTFRAIQDAAETDEHGRVLRDNVWGTQAEDAARRDFTINALYYDPVADTVLDYHNGVRDLEHKTLRMIGDPAARFREDPVRMLRVARFTAKLGFRIEPKTRKPIGELATLLQNVPAARLFDEMLKLLLSGQAMARPAGTAPRGPASRPAADARPDPRAARRRALRHGGARRHRRARARRQDHLARLSVRHAAVAAGARALAGRRRARRTLDPGTVRGDRLGTRRAGRADRDPAPLHRRHARDLDAAGALRAPHRPLAVRAGRAPALSRRLRLSAAALPVGRGAGRAGRMVDRVRGGRPRRARGVAGARAERRERPGEEAPTSQRQPARRGRRGR